MTALVALIAGAMLAVPAKKPVPHFFKKVDVGGYKLAIECRGKGSPIVVLDSGFSTPRSAWYWVVPRLERTTRVCSYDRAGVGQSQDRPETITPTTGQVVAELHTLLQRAKLPGPYILGGWSIGGFDVRYYQHRYPGEVAGLVVVDGSPPWFLLNEPEPLTSAFETMYTHAAAQALEPPPSMDALPVVDLTHGTQLDLGEAEWIREQTRFTSSSTNALFVKGRNSGHAIAEEKPGLVAYALKLVLKSVRRQKPLPQCALTRVPRLQGICLEP
jgi:pimeloyl-ACP methyl ester carboxylesterase